MKTIKNRSKKAAKMLMLTLLLVSNLILTSKLKAQAKQEVAVLNIDTKGLLLDAVQMGNLVRLELEKTNTCIVMDKYDMYDLIEQKGLKIDECFGTRCLIGMGKMLNVNRIVAGSVERYGEKIVITLRLIDINNERVLNSEVHEYLNIQPEIQKMVEISVKKLVGMPIDEDLKDRLVEEFNYESLTRNPGLSKVVLNGPRMGIAYITGDKGDRMEASKEEGGYDVYPVVTQFGYQHEVQYLNEGNFQAVFEIVGLISGIDQGLFIPSITFMNGFRNNKYGFEFAFGPNFGIIKKAEGYYKDGKWNLKKDWDGVEDIRTVERIDRRGEPILSSGFIWAIGKTFKSGHLNIPVNAYVAPGKEGWYVGLSLGFNSRK